MTKTLLVLALFFYQAPTDSDPAALEIFEAAAAAQCPAGAASEVETFQGEFSVTLWEDDQGKRLEGARTGTITQFWRKIGDKIQYHRFLEVNGEPGAAHLITDGRRYLIQEEGKEPRDLTERSLQQDLESLKDEVRRTSELMRLFFLENLRGADVTFKVLKKGQKLPIRQGRLNVEVDEILRTQAGETIVLVIDRKSRALREVRIRTADGKERESFRFDYHGYVDDGSGLRLLIPGHVEYWRDGKEILVARTDALHKIQFNKPISSKIFRALPVPK